MTCRRLIVAHSRRVFLRLYLNSRLDARTRDASGGPSTWRQTAPPSHKEACVTTPAKNCSPFGRIVGSIERRLPHFLRWLRQEHGNVGPLLAIMVVPIIGAFAIAGETASWHTHNRSQQNAADSAALAAALKKTTSEGTTVASSYGYTTNATTTTVTSATVACPTGAISGTTCYQVTIDRKVPVYLTRVVGYRGDTTINSADAQLIKASAIAGLTTGTNNFCMIGLTELKLGGGNGTDLTGCQLLSGSGGMQCSGTNSAAGVHDAYTAGSFQGNASNCGPNTVSGYTGYASALSDFQTRASDALSSISCAYVTAPPTITSLSGGATTCYEGKVTLGATTGNTIYVDDPNTILVVKTSASGLGGLDLNGQTLKTRGNGSLTIVFTGPTQITHDIIPSNGGTLDIAAPTSGPFAGFAIMEAPTMPNAVRHGSTYYLDMNFAGGAGEITLDISGIIYLPNATFNINGAIDHASNGLRCIGIVAKKINATGTNDIFSNPTAECRQQHASLPTVPVVALLQ